MIMVMVAAADIGIILQAVGEKCLHSIVSIPTDTAKNPDSSLRQRHLRTAAYAAADQGIHPLLPQKACQRAMSIAVGIHHNGGLHFSVFHLVKLEAGGMPKC